MINSGFDNSLLSFDNRRDVLNCRFSDGTPVWLNLRFVLRLKQMENASYVKGYSAKPSPSGSIRGELLKSIWHSLVHNPWRITPEADVLSIANYEGNPDCPNRMTVFLKELTGLKTAECLYSPLLRRFPDLKNTYSFDYFYYQAWIKSKIYKTKNSENFVHSLDAFMHELSGHFQDFIGQEQWNEIRSQCLFIDRLIVFYRKSITKWLKSIRPGFILCSEGNNGDWRHAVLFSEANKSGIPTAEVQHGIFNIGMKYGQDLACNEEFAGYKSSCIFTFGKYHCQQTNLPSVCVPLGHYDLERAARKYNLVNSFFKERDVLHVVFICEGNPPSSFDNGLIRYAAEAFGNLSRPFELIIRLHPSEQPDPKYNELLAFPGSRYSDSHRESIHELLISSDVVISHASTVVYEALYYNKPVFILKDVNTAQYIPDGIGIPFTNGYDLHVLLEAELLPPPARGDLWESGGVASNFRKFLSSINTHTHTPHEY